MLVFFVRLLLKRPVVERRHIDDANRRRKIKSLSQCLINFLVLEALELMGQSFFSNFILNISNKEVVSVHLVLPGLDVRHHFVVRIRSHACHALFGQNAEPGDPLQRTLQIGSHIIVTQR